MYYIVPRKEKTVLAVFNSMDIKKYIQHLEVAEAFVNKFVAMTFGNYQGIGTKIRI